VVYGTTETLNLYVKNVEGVALKEVVGLEGRFKLNGRVFDFNAEVVFVGSKDGVVRVYDRGTEAQVKEFLASKHKISCLHYSRLMRLLLTGSENGSVGIWDPEEDAGPVFKFANLHFGRVVGITTSANLMMTAGGGELILSDLRTFTVAMTLSLDLPFKASTPPMHSSLLTVHTSGEDNLLLVSSSADRRLFFYHFKDG
jgi:WD40 repeat protein